METWNSRDYPVLRETARLVEEAEIGQGARLADIAAAADVEVEAAIKALRALEADGMVEVRWMMPAHAARVVQISGEARRQVGLWPTPSTGLERMIEALEAIAEHTDDEDKRTRARRVLDGLSGAGKSVGLAMATAYATGQIPT
jgi:hypothetical protein